MMLVSVYTNLQLHSIKIMMSLLRNPSGFCGRDASLVRNPHRILWEGRVPPTKSSKDLVGGTKDFVGGTFGFHLRDIPNFLQQNPPRVFVGGTFLEEWKNVPPTKSCKDFVGGTKDFVGGTFPEGHFHKQ